MLASNESKEYITKGELEFDDDKIPVMEVSGCMSVSIGVALVVTASNDMASRMPHTMPEEPFMIFSKHLMRACTILKLSSINIFCPYDVTAIFTLFGFTFFL